MKPYAAIVLLPLSLALCAAAQAGAATVQRDGDSVFIVDQHGEQWDVTQAEQMGFEPERFQYGIGRDAFTPLDESLLTDDARGVAPGTRVIGIARGAEAQAYSVRKLSRHEVANTSIAEKPIAVGY